MFWAHSDPDGLKPNASGSRWQPLAEHLSNVCLLAEEMAREAAPLNETLHRMAAMAGILHDVGKYTDCFQGMLQGSGKRCKHAIHGAIAARHFGLGSDESAREWAMPIVRAIAAHHAGLLDEAALESKTRSQSRQPTVKADYEEAQTIWQTAVDDQAEIIERIRKGPPSAAIGSEDLLTRMLLSCLVDADRLDTAGRENMQTPLDAPRLLSQLTEHLARLRGQAVARGANPVVSSLRDRVQELCSAAASSEARLLSLAVPTGGGKTLAAMRFALERASARPDRHRRVIVVIPFLSIIEQNAAVYRSVFGEDAVFEHHSGAVYKTMSKTTQDEGADYFSPEAEDEQERALTTRPETENWDAPVIVTTSVRFFESLFSNHPSDLRRVHNIARSVIILDEVQMLPRRLMAPLLAMLRGLSADWGCTVVMATATQPAFEARLSRQENYGWPPGTVSPIIPMAEVERMHTALRRVHIEWRLKEPTRWDALADELLRHPQVLCVVNLRRHASLLHALLRARAEDEQQRESIFHLSTRMCAQHRLDVLGVIRERLDAGLPCVVVSTQLIEAGVDVDFPIAYRALGPLDAVIQVAGRVDREGMRTAAMGAPAGKLVVFATEDGKTPPHGYEEATAITRSLALEGDVQTDDLAAMQRYFERYYGEADGASLGTDLEAMRNDEQLKFATLADQFEMINSRSKDVFVPYGVEGMSRIDELQKAFVLNKKLLGRLQRYSVGLQPWEFESAREKGLIQPHPRIENIWTCSSTAYSERSGLLEEHDRVGFII